MEVLTKQQLNKGCTVFTSYDAKKHIQVHGKQLEDLIAILKLQKLMLDVSTAFAKFVIPEHHDKAC